jgi:hypothetical protein
MSSPVGPFQFFPKIPGDICSSSAPRVVDTGGKFGHAPVLLIPVVHLKKIQNEPNVIMKKT